MDLMIWIFAAAALVGLIAALALRFGQSAATEVQKTEEETEELSGDNQDAEQEVDIAEEDEADGDLYEEEEEDIEEVSLTTERAEVADLRIEQRPPGLYKSPREQLKFLAEFTIYKGKKIVGSRSIEIPEKLYDTLKVGEKAALITQGDRFIDFGDRTAEACEI